MLTEEEKRKRCAATRKWQKANKKKQQSYNRRWAAKNPQYQQQYDRKYTLKKYGLTEEQYAEMLTAQNNSCAICEAQDPGRRERTQFYVDHDHDTGKVRGLLCHGCNVGLGYFKDNQATLIRAADYLDPT